MWQRQDLVGSDFTWQRTTLQNTQPPAQRARPRRPVRLGGWRLVTGIALLVALVGGGLGVYRTMTPAHAGCPTYTVQWGDTMWMIAQRYHTDTWSLARLNGISNPNRINAGRVLCVASSPSAAKASSGGVVGNQLEWSSQPQVRNLLINAADRHRLPRNLVLAIAWRESTWTQHVIAWDGGVGTMQLMPYTTAWLNSYFGTGYNPYRLTDNIELGVSYLAILWNDFHGDLNPLISAYNEGERNVRTHGIFNWWYVNSVRGLMNYFG